MNRLGAMLRLGARQVPAMSVRSVHKGFESAPPMRWVSGPEKVAVFFLIVGTFLSYPTYVLLNMKNWRPVQDNSLSPEVQAQIDEIRASRAAARR